VAVAVDLPPADVQQALVSAPLAAPSMPDEISPPAPLPSSPLPPVSLDDSVAGDHLPADASAVREQPSETPPPPKTLHIRCPSGHVVKAPSDLLGKNGRCPACKKTFELRYENSIEFQRRSENIFRREQGRAERAWLGWAFVAAFVVFVAIVAAVILLGR